MFRGDRAFLMKTAEKMAKSDGRGRNSYAISTYEEIICLRYCWINNVRIREFDDKLMETFKRIKEMFEDKIKVKNFNILGPFASMTHMNFLPTLFDEYIHALNFELTVRYEELIYISINPDVLRIPIPPEKFSIKDSYGNTAMYSPDSDENLNINSLCKFLCDPGMKIGNRQKILLSRMYKNDVHDENICQIYVNLFETSTDPQNFFKMVEICTSFNTMITTKNFLRSKNAKYSIMTDTFTKPLKDVTYEAFTIERDDGWKLQVLVDDMREFLIKFWVLHEKSA